MQNMLKQMDDKRLEERIFCAHKKASFTPKKIMETTYRYKYQKDIENGLCIGCKKPIDRDGVYCSDCREEHNNRVRMERIYYQSNRVCPRCRKNSLAGDEKTCLECNSKQYAYNMQNREKLGIDHYNKQHAEWSKRTHHEMITKGICTRCRKRKADVGFKTCGICRAKTRNYKRMKYGKTDRQERHKQGICYFCDNSVKEGYKVCEEHYQKNVENARSGRAKKAREKLLKEGILY